MEIKEIIRRKKIICILIFALIMLVFLNSLVFFNRFDLSDRKLFSVSSYTESVLAHIPELVHITYYVSDDMKLVYPSVQNVIDFLYDYERISNGMVTIEIISPEKEGLQNVLQMRGIMPEQLQVTEENRTSFVNVYSTIVIEYLDKIAFTPFIIDSNQLEYRLTNSIVRFMRPLQEVRILLGNGASLETEYPHVSTWLSDAGFSYTVLSDVAPSSLFDTTALLLVLGSSLLDADETAEIQRFLSHGGNAVFFVSSHTAAIFSDWSIMPSEYTDVLSLLESYGVTLANSILADISHIRLRMQLLENDAISTRYQYIQYPFWIVTLNEFISNQNPITSEGFEGLELFWANPLYISEVEGITVNPLTYTTPSAWLVNSPYYVDPFGKHNASENPSSVGQYITSVAIEDTRFLSPERIAPVSASAIASAEGGRGGQRLLVVGDQYVPSVMIEYSDSPHNMDFMVNALLWSSGEDDLLGLKNKVPFDTRLTKVTDTAEFAFLQRLTYSVVFGIVPVTVLILALLVFIKRRKNNFALDAQGKRIQK